MSNDQWSDGLHMAGSKRRRLKVLGKSLMESRKFKAHAIWLILVRLVIPYALRFNREIRDVTSGGDGAHVLVGDLLFCLLSFHQVIMVILP